MTKKTLYVSDMDGTLLNSQSILSPTTINTLNRLVQEHDLLFTVATARTPATVVELMKEVKTSLPYIVMAGAAMWNNQNRQYQQVQTIDNDVIEQLLTVYNHYNINPFIYRRHGNQIYAHHIAQMTEDEKLFINHRLSTPFKRLITEASLSSRNSDEVMLVFSMGNFSSLQAIADEIKVKKIPCSLVCYHDLEDYSQGILEVYAEGTTKAAAIRQLANELGIERIVVFGDNLNDLPMMEIADHSLAVSNAFEEVKNQADEVIGRNDEDAVVRWIEQDLQTVYSDE